MHLLEHVGFSQGSCRIGSSNCEWAWILGLPDPCKNHQNDELKKGNSSTKLQAEARQVNSSAPATLGRLFRLYTVAKGPSSGICMGWQRQLSRLDSPLLQSFSSSFAQEPLNVGELFLHSLIDVAMDSLGLMLHCSDLAGQVTSDLCLLPVLLMHCRFHLIQPFLQLTNSVIGLHVGILVMWGLAIRLWLDIMEFLLNPRCNGINLTLSELMAASDFANLGRRLVT